MMQAFWVFDSVLVIIAFVLGSLLFKWVSEKKVGDASERARQIIAAGEREAEAQRKAADLEAKAAALKARGEFEDEVRRRERGVQQVEQRALLKEEQLGRKIEEVERRLSAHAAKERTLVERETVAAQQEGRLAHALEEQRRKLEVVAGLTAEEAKRQLLVQMEADARR